MATTTQSNLSDMLPGFPVREETPVMHVRKRDGGLEPVDVNKIVRAVQRCGYGLGQVDAIRIASKTIGKTSGARARPGVCGTMRVGNGAEPVAHPTAAARFTATPRRDPCACRRDAR